MKSIVILFLFLGGIANGQNTMSLNANTTSPKATIAEAAWMTGHWKGEAFGGITEEIWSPPSAGSMMFVFRLIVDGEVNWSYSRGR
jgi:hypothetical protein